MDKIRRWNKLAVWLAISIIDIDGKTRDYGTATEHRDLRQRLETLKLVLGKMQEIEKEIPEPDEY